MHAQNSKETDSLPILELIEEIKLDSISVVANDSIPSKKPLLLDLIKYTAQDSKLLQPQETCNEGEVRDQGRRDRTGSPPLE